MELIEAIYLSLALFSIGVIVLLVISFTSYKVKKKLGTNDDNSSTGHELKPKLELKNGKPIQKTKPHSKPVIKKEREKIKISDDRKKTTSSEKRSKRYEPKPKKNIITKTEQPRIEVLNKAVKETTKIEEAKNKKPLENNSDTKIKKDLLDHYSDTQDDEFKSMTE